MLSRQRHLEEDDQKRAMVLRMSVAFRKNPDQGQVLLRIRREPVDQENLLLKNPVVLRPSSSKRARS